MTLPRRWSRDSSQRSLWISFVVALLAAACGGVGGGELDFDFDIPRTEPFQQDLSSYGIYQSEMASLAPADGVHLYEMSSVLFTDYAKKQRLVKLPAGQSAQVVGNGPPHFPDGTVIAKTFYYPNDFRDEELGKRIIETRLLVRTGGVWNVATYIWNDAQTDAVLSLDTVTTTVNWISDSGQVRSTQYLIPGEVECVSCHQSADQVVPLGLTVRNLNRDVARDGQVVNQLAYLQSLSVIGPGPGQISTIVDYNDVTASLENRARAYLDANCAHCHNPDAWEKPAGQDLDLRYEIPLEDSGILGEMDDLAEFISEGEMPFLGTTVLHDEGIQLVLDYLESL